MFVMYQDCVSPHQVPLARELVARLGAENFRYVYRDKTQADRVKLGWKMCGEESWFVHIGSKPVNARNILDNAEVLLSGMRDLKLFENRCAKGLKTFYSSERWFKPVALKFLRWHIMFPGRIRMLIPSYRRMAKAYACWLNRDQNACYLAIGPWAKKDMLAIGVKPEKIQDWGYFVEEGKSKSEKVKSADDSVIKVLWVGRLLDWKCVDTLIRAIAHLNSQPSTLNPQPSTSSTPLHLYTAKKYTLTIIGDGPEKPHLQKLANHLSPTPTTYYNILSNIPISQVREEMRKHDVYVLASNAMEGWGAALSEALSEGMVCFGTYEAGASAALLPDSQLFHSGDHKELARKLSALQFPLSTTTIPSVYTPSGAAEKLMQML